MSFDLELALIIAVFVTGLIWLADALWARPQRRRRAAEAQQLGETQENAYREPWFVDYSRSFFPVLLAVLILRSFVAEPFRIPSGSMMPTLLVGDFILVNKFDYGLRLPLLRTKIVPIGEPHRGDVVVFHYPEKEALKYCSKNPACILAGGQQQVVHSAGEDYIKRLIGLPGDHICFKGNDLIINGKPVKKTYDGIYKGEGPNHLMQGAQIWTEDLPRRDGSVFKHKILIMPGVPVPSGCVTVPAKHYFMMGDNRDDSFDSRFWGFVPARDLVGKAFIIWMNWGDGQMNFHRIGKIIPQ
ncbi:signal peptidase I [Acidihalobacter ferrooxydans]|uniref:Signal peptidase I n=1 Tax=Acidihalobacter ferrooxydans TaxID=1765967 RepID=A0A1P8UHM5_9GAMM|nr:signal peptidase I [Acidihalobacter ferrooxydans]APZ43317.1 signal peptidase I [Acidihalobacter ferrooxydans]